MKNIIAISGSTRQNSTNHHLINAIAALANDIFEVIIWEGIEKLPHFNADYSTENVPAAITDFREMLSGADGIIICTPEYAHGVPGSLKNAIDWVVASASLSGKPTVLITASTDGRYGHASLLETLRVIEAKDVNDLQLLISFARTKVNGNKITDEKTLNEVENLIQRFLKSMNE